MAHQYSNLNYKKSQLKVKENVSIKQIAAMLMRRCSLNMLSSRGNLNNSDDNTRLSIYSSHRHHHQHQRLQRNLCGLLNAEKVKNIYLNRKYAFHVESIEADGIVARCSSNKKLHAEHHLFKFKTKIIFLIIINCCYCVILFLGSKYLTAF